MITQEELKKQLTYDEKSGVFNFNINKGGMKKGDIAGYTQKDGYIAISVNGKQYKAHRLAWLYVYGYLPNHHLDHINMIKDDNRLSNLREATRSQNHMNRSVYSNNKLGVKGVHMVGKKYRALIKKDGKQICLGIFDSLSKARQTYKQASKKMHGEFARS